MMNMRSAVYQMLEDVMLLGSMLTLAVWCLVAYEMGRIYGLSAVLLIVGLIAGVLLFIALVAACFKALNWFGKVVMSVVCCGNDIDTHPHGGFSTDCSESVDVIPDNEDVVVVRSRILIVQ